MKVFLWSLAGEVFAAVAMVVAFHADNPLFVVVFGLTLIVSATFVSATVLVVALTWEPPRSSRWLVLYLYFLAAITSSATFLGTMAP